MGVHIDHQGFESARCGFQQERGIDRELPGRAQIDMDQPEHRKSSGDLRLHPGEGDPGACRASHRHGAAPDESRIAFLDPERTADGILREPELPTVLVHQRNAGIDVHAASQRGRGCREEWRMRRARSVATVDFRARVYVRTSADEWIEVTRRGAESASVRASGTSEAALVTSARVTAGSYDRVRVRFEEVNANVTSFRIGVGTLLSGSFHVSSEGGHAGTVEREGSFEIRGGSSARLLIDLNSGAWLSRANTQTRAVSRADFESAVRLRVE
jgi:hypothetical protein